MFVHVRVEFGCLLPSLIQFALSYYFVNIMKVYIEKNIVLVELIRFRKNSDFIDFTNFEVGIEPILSMFSLLSATSRHYSVLSAPHVSGHDHFGTECRSKCQFGSNSLIFTSFMAV